jgi:hypothetical protein
MKFEKEYRQERIKFFDGLAKFVFAFLIIIASGIGGLLISKEKLSDLYFQNLLLLGAVIETLAILFILYLLNKQYTEISKLK